MPSVASDASGFIVAATNACSGTVASTSVSSSGSGSSITLTVSCASATAGAYFLCVRWTTASPRMLLSSLNIITLASLLPRAVPLVNAAVVSFNGGAFINVATDPVAFTLATSCTTPTPSAVASITSTLTSSSLITLTVDASGATAGAYRLCMRTSATSDYVSTLPLNLLQVTALQPDLLTMPALLSASLSGNGFVTVATDTAAFSVSSSACSAPTDVGATVTSTLVSLTTMTMSVRPNTAAAGTYYLCWRVEATTPYFDTLQTVSFGECCWRSECLVVNSC